MIALANLGPEALAEWLPTVLDWPEWRCVTGAESIDPSTLPEACSDTPAPPQGNPDA